MTLDDRLGDVGLALLLTVTQAGELLGLSRSSVYALVRGGKLPIVYPGGPVRSHPAHRRRDVRRRACGRGDGMSRLDTIDAWLAAQRVEALR